MKKSTPKEPWTPPRGIRYRNKPGREKPFILIWSEPEAGEKWMAYESEATRELAAKALAEKRRNHGEAVSRFDPKMWARYLEFQRIVGEGVDPVVVAVEWRASKQGTPAGIGM